MYLCTFWHEQPSEKETEDFGADVMWPLMRKRYSDCVPIEITVDDLPTMAYFEYPGLD